MRTLRNIMGALVIAAFALMAPMGHLAEARMHHRHGYHAMGTSYTGSGRTYGYVPSTNPYDNGHANAINKVREKWRNSKQTVRYNTYRMSHSGKTSAAERAQDRAPENGRTVCMRHKIYITDSSL